MKYFYVTCITKKVSQGLVSRNNNLITGLEGNLYLCKPKCFVVPNACDHLGRVANLMCNHVVI